MSNVILRKFWLENESGDSVPLNGERGIWLIDPTGLGVNNNSSFTNFSNGFFRTVDADKDPQQTIAGDLYFIDNVDPYVSYRRFIDWVLTSNTIYLVYAPTATQFRRKIRLSHLTKTELMTQDCLKVPIAMYGLTPWFRILEYEIRGSTEENVTPYIVGVTRLITDGQEETETNGGSGSSGGEEAPIDDGEEGPNLDGASQATPIVGAGGDDDEAPTPVDEDTIVQQPRLVRDHRHSTRLSLIVSGQLPAGFSVTYTGSLKNPSITIRGKESGVLYGQCVLTDVDSTGTDTFTYSSNYEDSYITMKTRSETLSLLNNISRLTESVYPKIPVQEFCTLEINSDEDISSVIYIKVYEYYRGV